MSAIGCDPQAIAEAIKAMFDPETLGADVLTNVGTAPMLPALGIFPAMSGDFMTYYETFSRTQLVATNWELIGRFEGFAEDATRHLFALCASGTGHPRSVPDALMQTDTSGHVTLGGKVESAFVGSVQLRSGGDENAGWWEAVWPLTVMVRRAES